MNSFYKFYEVNKLYTNYTLYPQNEVIWPIKPHAEMLIKGQYLRVSCHNVERAILKHERILLSFLWSLII